MDDAVAVRSQEADAVLATLIFCAKSDLGCTTEKAPRIVKENLAYYAAYCDDETRERVERLYDCAHPIFGKFAENGSPGPEEAFRLGLEMGRTGELVRWEPKKRDEP